MDVAITEGEEEEEGCGKKMSSTEKFKSSQHKYQGRSLIFLRFNWIMYAYFHLGMMKQF